MRPWRATEPITSAEVFVGFSSGEIAGLFVAGSLVVAAWVAARGSYTHSLTHTLLYHSAHDCLRIEYPTHKVVHSLPNG